MTLHDEERLFIDAIRDLNFQASQMQAEENDQQTEKSEKSEDLDEEIRKERGIKFADKCAAVIAVTRTSNKNNSFNHVVHTDAQPAGNLESALSWMQAVATKPNNNNNNNTPSISINTVTNSEIDKENKKMKFDEENAGAIQNEIHLKKIKV